MSTGRSSAGEPLRFTPATPIVPGTAGQFLWKRADGVPGWMNRPEIKRLALAEIAEYIKGKGDYARSGLETITIDGNLSFEDLVFIARIIEAIPKEPDA